MPIKITKYRCQFKCGTFAKGTMKLILGHEERCIKNPVNKTCASCSNAVYEKDSDEFNVWHYRSCRIREMAFFFTEVHEFLAVFPSRHVKPLVKCPNHNQSIAVAETDDYINEVRKKILDAEKRSERDCDDFPF